MAYILKQSTAGQILLLGKFVDATDGNTEETALTIANTDIKIWKNGATSIVNKNSGGATHIASGEYYATFDAVDTDTVGPMKIFVHMAGALYVEVACQVVEEATYDFLYAAGATPIADINAEVDTALAEYDPPTAAELTSEINDVQSDVAAVQSDVTGIKAKTDQFQFSTPNFVDANVQYVDDTRVIGSGTAGDPWGPAGSP